MASDRGTLFRVLVAGGLFLLGTSAGAQRAEERQRGQRAEEVLGLLDAEVLARVPKVTIIAPNAMTTKQAMALFVDAVEATGLKVVVKKDTVIIKLGANMPKTCPSVATTSTSAPVGVADVPPAAPDPEAEALAAQIDAGIKKVDDTTYVIAKSLVDAVLANPMAIAKGARVVPAVKNGKPDGFKLYAIRPSSVYAKLGLTNGDLLQSINGFELTSADKALEVYTKLREATQLEVEITRRGKPQTLKYSIR